MNTVEKAFITLKQLGTPEKTYLNEDARQAFETIFCSREFNLQTIEYCLRYEFIDISIDTLEFIQPNLLKNDVADKEEGKKLLNLAQMIIGLNLNLSYFSSSYCIAFQEKPNSIKVITKFLEPSPLQDLYAAIASTKNHENWDEINSIFRFSVGILLYVSKNNDNLILMWEVLVVEKLLIYSKKFKDIEDNMTYSYITLVFLANDRTVGKYPELRNIIPHLVNMTESIAKRLKENKNIERDRMQINENELVEISVESINGINWNLADIINALYHMALSDILKSEIYFENKMNVILRDLIMYGNNAEKELAFK